VSGPLPLARLEPASLDPRGIALFLDFDGTLADFVPDPAAVALTRDIIGALDALQRALSGALAVVSGRPIADLDRLLAPLRLPLAGVHGLERRNAAGIVTHLPAAGAAIRDAGRRLGLFAAKHPGLIVEPKPGSVALHYRQRPDLEALCRSLADELVRADPRLKLLHGKMVIEIKGGDATKADAILNFMGEPPFRGRRPLFVGDDVTDEDGFRAVAGQGLAVKIGPGDTAATYRAEGIDEFRGWLRQVSHRFGGEDLAFRRQQP
jgi:trehalose 6-phosphate phosphatase